MQGTPSGFGWLFATAFLAIPTCIFCALSAGFHADSDEWLRRMDALDPSERFVTGEVQVAKEGALLTSPANNRPCLAWETVVGVSWTKKNSNDEDETASATLRASGAATPMVVTDSRAGVLATVNVPRLELLGAAMSGKLDGIPAWSAAFEVKDSDVTDSGRSYWWREQVLAPGATVTFFAKSGEVVAPLEGHDRLVVFIGTPEAWREQLEGLASAAKWTRRVAFVLGPIALICLAMFIRTRLRRREG